MSKIKIFGLGGLSESGKNSYVIEVDDDIYVFDAGIKFASGNLLGIDYIMPDFTYLVKNRKRIKGLFITHGHRYGVNSGTAYLEELIDTEGYDFVMYGHTHRRDLTTYKNSYIVNPGSLALPRDNRVGTYMLLDFDQHGTPFFAENELPRLESNVSSFRRKFDM